MLYWIIINHKKEANKYNRLFEVFGENGFELLQDMGMNFSYPNFCRDNFSSGKIGSKNVFIVNVTSHKKVGTEIRLEFVKNNKLKTFLSSFLNINKTKKGKSKKERYRACKQFNKYSDAIDTIEKLLSTTIQP